MIKVISAPRFPKNFHREMKKTIFEDDRTKIESIVSPAGFSDPKEKWYNQEYDEWVMVMGGVADLLFEDGKLRRMEKGDSTYIPAHTKHRVERAHHRTEWLAIFYKK